MFRQRDDLPTPPFGLATKTTRPLVGTDLLRATRPPVCSVRLHRYVLLERGQEFSDGKLAYAEAAAGLCGGKNREGSTFPTSPRPYEVCLPLLGPERHNFGLQH